MILFTFSCVEEFDTFTPLPESIELTSILSPEDAYATINFSNDQGISFSTINGTRISVPANAFFINATNAKNEITFNYLEIYSKGDKIKFDVPTISNGQLLESDGVFYFDAKSGNEKASLIPGKQIKVQLLNNQPNPGMELFYGERSEDRFNWNEADQDSMNTGGIQILEERDTTGEVLIGYEFFTDSLKWINVDVFVDIPKEERTVVCIELPETYNHENTTIYMVFRNYNSVLTLHTEEGSSKFCEPYGATPIGEEVIFVVISKQGEETYHFALMDDVITAGYVADMFPEETPLSEILAALDNL